MAYLKSLPLFMGVAKFTLDPMLRVLSMCGNPHLRLPPVVHVTGTNGKGSVVAYSNWLLHRTAGANVVAFTSPHAAPDFSNHLTVNCQPIDPAIFATAVVHVKEAMERGEQTLPPPQPYVDYLTAKDAIVDGPHTTTPPSQFEFITVACLYAVANLIEPKPDVFVVEVGLGGRLDCTNVIPPPACAVFTSIDNDHAAVLGDTPEKIAREKSGIVKPGTEVVVSYPQRGEVGAILAAAAEECGARFEHQPEALAPGDADPHSPSHLNRNYRLAKRVVEILRENAATEHLFHGAPAAFPARAQCHVGNVLTEGRFEILDALAEGMRHEVIFDGAHNTQAVAALEQTVKLHFEGHGGRGRGTPSGGDHEELIMVVGVLKDKDISALAPIYSRFNNGRTTFYPVPVSNPRALPPAQLSDALVAAGVRPSHIHTAPSIPDAFTRIAGALRRPAAGNSVVLVTGSFYLLSAARQALRDAFGGFALAPRA
eukprot:TRINITY_DN27181_c0_g1_i1.p1 TRINITY_DN27181_c0_g1~~TRINITY_DN27181_c0_g1_i1.p1  ORF type:complete len:520 (+),score=185.71 TRINITY_DN27181_c0_g1_i1:112-1560(+)